MMRQKLSPVEDKNGLQTHSLEGKCNGPAIAVWGMQFGGPNAIPATADRLSRIWRINVRTFIRLAGVAGALVFAAACSGKDKSSMSDDFKKDLERASTASEITLPSAQPAQQVVSDIERTTPPAPRRVAQSQRVAKHKPAPTHTPAPVEVQQGDVSTEVETAPSEPAPAPVTQDPLPSPRPQPVASTGAGTGEAGQGRGHGGIGIGDIIGVVLRGGVVDGDDCDPRTEGRGRGGISINTRFPPIGVGTFPGSGRIGGTLPGGRGGRRF
jgi:hypothetical protein